MFSNAAEVSPIPEQSLVVLPTGGADLAPATTEQYAALRKISRRVADDECAEFVYRGCKLRKLARELGVKSSDVNKLAGRLFYVGAKAKAYFEHAPSNAPTLPDLQAANKTTMETVRAAIEEAFAHPVSQMDGTAHVLETLKTDSKEFIDYFSNKFGAGSFSAALTKSASSDAGEALLYYYHLLHTLGRWAQPKSVHISSSKNLQIATEFATHGNGPGVVLVGWIPRATLPYGDSETSTGRDQAIHANLPVPAGPFYPSQQEVSLRGAFFPHYLLGLFLLKSGQFVANPRVVSANDEDDLISRGFKIPPGDFLDRIALTKYVSCIWRIDEKYFYEEVVTRSAVEIDDKST